MPPSDACTHCGLPVPGNPPESDGPRFCCAGCQAVYTAIQDAGLQQFYAIRDDDALTAADPSQHSYEELDDPTFLDRAAPLLPDGSRRIRLTLSGLTCSACVWLTERLGRGLPGVEEIRVDFGRSRVAIHWDPARVTLPEIARRFDAFGYRVYPLRPEETRSRARREDRDMLIRLGVTGACAGNVMLISFALYGGAFHGIETRFEGLFRLASWILTWPALLLGGTVFFRRAWAGWRAGTVHTDLPVSVGILAGFLSGTWHVWTGTGEVYFDSVTALIFLLLAGRYLQTRQQRQAVESAELLHALTPRRALLIDASGRREVPVEALRPGSRVYVRSGDVIPADGVVRDGKTSVDRSLLSGESLPHPVEPGDVVHAGTTNVQSPVEVEVTACGEESRVGQLTQLVESFTARRAEIVTLADRIAGWFVSVVLILAAVTAALWLSIDPSRALDSTTALLIVCCPCALALATPLAVTAALGQAARAGYLIQGGRIFEQLSRPGMVWLDKTGTVTRGSLSLVDWHGEASLKPRVAALEAHSSHPIGRTLATELAGSGPELAVTEVRETSGSGIEGLVDGSLIAVTSPRDATIIDSELEAAISQLTERGITPAVVSVDGVARAVAGVADPVLPDAPAAVARLRRAGWQVGLLSGDHPQVVARVGESLGLDPECCHGAVSPEEKLAVVERSQGMGPVAMVGDGVNDAVALAAADIGVAVRGGAEAALQAADVYVTRAGLGAVVDLIEGSGRTLRTIRRNLAFSLFYNVVGAGLAVAGLMHPLGAALLMPLSSLTVIFCSYRSRHFVPAPETGTTETTDETRVPHLAGAVGWK